MGGLNGDSYYFRPASARRGGSRPKIVTVPFYRARKVIATPFMQ
jgi:hypothetical protein